MVEYIIELLSSEQIWTAEFQAKDMGYQILGAGTIS